MATTLATKQDLQFLRQEIENRHALVMHEFASLRGNVSRDLETNRTDLNRDMEALRTSMSKDMEALRLSMTVRLGGMLVVSMGLLFAALKLT